MSFLNFLKGTNKDHKSIRVKTSIGDKFINVNLDQTHESLDILSLKVFQKDLYRLFDADYGIIVGRVVGNNAVGIPNCRISVFIPFDEEEITEPTKIDDIEKLQAAALYTYENVYDRDVNNKIYNLLPKYGKNRNFNGFPDNDYGIGATPKTPVGTFPEKEEILANDSLVYVYDKYYRYTTVTNESGDYILVVPSNRTFTINMSCDITDIGKFSTVPALLKTDGYPDNFFKNNYTVINDDLPLEALPNVEIQNIPITVKPLWSQDSENTNVGINRLDFTLNKKIQPHTTVIGNYFTQNESTWWGDRINFRGLAGLRSLCVNIFGNCSPATTNNWIEVWAGFRFHFPLKIRIPYIQIVPYIELLPRFSIYNPFGPNWIIGPLAIGPYGIGPITIIDTCIRLFNLTANLSDFGDDCDIRICLGFRIKYIIPFFNFMWFTKRYCTLRGGKTKLDPWDFRWELVSECTRSRALAILGGEITDGLFLEKHEGGDVDIQVYSIKNTIDDNVCDVLNSVSPGDTTITTSYDINSNIELLDTNRYVKYTDDGNFVVLLPTNRKKVVTNEEGDLVEVPFDSSVGVFTEFRGYFIFTHLGNVQNPPTQHRTAKIRLKVPQFFDYRFSRYPWIWKHYKFEYGEVYSVAQYNEVRFAHFDQNEESGEDDMLFPRKTKGWDEQTNIFFTGIKNDNTNNIYYEPNNNPDTEFTSFYNHISYLGLDADIKYIDVTSDPPEVPPQPPQPPTTDYTTYNAQFRKDGTFSFTDTTIQNPPQVLYFTVSSSDYQNLNFIIDYIRIILYTVDENFPNQQANYKLKITRDDNGLDITKYTDTSGSEWLSLSLSNVDSTTFEQNNFTINSNNMLKPIVAIPETPYLNINDSVFTYNYLNGFIPCTLYLRKEYPNLNNPTFGIKQISIGIKVVQ